MSDTTDDQGQPAETPVPRRVITGERDGRAVFARDEVVEAIAGTPMFPVWGWDSEPVLPIDADIATPAVSIFPPPGGVRITMIAFPPDTGEGTQIGPGRNEAWDEAVTANAAHRERSNDSQFVATDSVDIMVMVDGELTLTLDDGAERVLRPGDVLVQNGTRHSWANRSGRTCLAAAVVVHATSAGD